jgi:hypothetical protein
MGLKSSDPQIPEMRELLGDWCFGVNLRKFAKSVDDKGVKSPMNTPPANTSPAAEPPPVADTYALLLTCRQDRLLQIGRGGSASFSGVLRSAGVGSDQLELLKLSRNIVKT